MWNLNASSVNFVCFILKYSVKYAQNFIWKYVWQQSYQSLNIKDKYFAVSSTAYCSHSVTFWHNHTNNKRGVFHKRSCLNLSVWAWQRILCQKNSSRNFPTSRGHLSKSLWKIDTDGIIERKHSSGWKLEADNYWQSGQAMASTSSSLHLSTRRTFWT